MAVEIANHINILQNHSPDSLLIINGDFNNCVLDSELPNFNQHVSCLTRTDPSTQKESTLDLFYSNVKDSYMSTRLPPLGRSDHNNVSMLPRYIPRVLREKPTSRTVQQWTPDACDNLIGALEVTDWDVIIDNSTDVNNILDRVTLYISCCVDSIIPKKEVKVYCNNKPWINQNIKSLVKEKKKVFHDKDKLKTVQSELKKEIKKGKKEYKAKVV